MSPKTANPGQSAAVLLEDSGGDSDLFHVVQAVDPLGLAQSPRQRRQHHARHDPDNGDHGQQFDQGKASGAPRETRANEFQQQHELLN